MTIANKLFLPLALLGVALAALAGYHWAKANVAQDIYRDRLTVLQQDYQKLAEQYNQAVTPRPVTELLVEDQTVCVIVRMGDGQVQRFPTQFNAWDNELFVDYALIDGRLLIRRVFDQNTAPGSEQAIVIDPDLVEVQWDAPGALHGQAIYRNRMADGRWVISATQNGALGLTQIDDDQEVKLIARPTVKDFAPVDEQAHAAVDSIGVGDVWQYLTD